MSTAPNILKQYITEGESNCRELGYTKCGANWYRCYGQGLLQVVTFQGIPERVNDVVYSREPTVLFDVYSLFDKLLWIRFPLMGKRRDLIPRFLPSAILQNAERKAFLGTAYEAECMNTCGFALLNRISTHAHLAEMLEKFTAFDFGSVPNCKKVVPYLLSCEFQKSIDCINAIEKQNMSAYQQERMRNPNADNEQQLQKILSRLQPFFALRDGLLARDLAGITVILQNNYQVNAEYLLNMGVPIPDDITFPADWNEGMLLLNP